MPLPIRIVRSVCAQRSLTSEHGTVFHAVRFVYFEICRGARVRGLTRIILRAPGRIQKSRVRRAGVLVGAGGFPFDCPVVFLLRIPVMQVAAVRSPGNLNLVMMESRVDQTIYLPDVNHTQHIYTCNLIAS